MKGTNHKLETCYVHPCLHGICPILRQGPQFQGRGKKNYYYQTIILLIVDVDPTWFFNFVFLLIISIRY